MDLATLALSSHQYNVMASAAIPNQHVMLSGIHFCRFLVKPKAGANKTSFDILNLAMYGTHMAAHTLTHVWFFWPYHCFDSGRLISWLKCCSNVYIRSFIPKTTVEDPQDFKEGEATRFLVFFKNPLDVPVAISFEDPQT